MSQDKRNQDLAAIGLLDEPVRRRLYELVAGRVDPIGRDEAARSLGISRPLATFHLDRLASAGLLETGYKRLTGRSGPGAGRPARIYWRPSREVSVSLPDRRYAQAAQIFATALERMGDALPPAAVVDVARQLGQDLGSQAEPARDPAERLMRTLEHAGYEPAIEDRDLIRLRNCPFDALADRHRSLVCGTNLALAQGIVDGAGAEDFKPTLDLQPGYCCVVFRRERDADETAGQLQAR